MTENTSIWEAESAVLARKLHRSLSINETEWHKLKGIPQRRAAELLSASLIKLIAGENISDTEEMITQSLLWIKGEVKDPGCPHR